jgi:hypothetical protein
MEKHRATGEGSISLTLDTYSHVAPSMQQQASDEMENFFQVGEKV